MILCMIDLQEGRIVASKRGTLEEWMWHKYDIENDWAFDFLWSNKLEIRLIIHAVGHWTKWHLLPHKGGGWSLGFHPMCVWVLYDLSKKKESRTVQTPTQTTHLSHSGQPVELWAVSMGCGSWRQVRSFRTRLLQVECQVSHMGFQHTRLGWSRNLKTPIFDLPCCQIVQFLAVIARSVTVVTLSWFRLHPTTTRGHLKSQASISTQLTAGSVLPHPTWSGQVTGWALTQLNSTGGHP